MKISILITLIALKCSSAFAQDFKTNRAKIDTANGHGYEILVMATPVQKNVEAGSFRINDYTFNEAKHKLDSLQSLGENWSLPTVGQLKSIYSAFKTTNTSKNSMQWQGVYGFYWCKNVTRNSNGVVDNNLMNAAGANNIYAFKVIDGLIDSELTDRGGVQKVKYRLAFIKSY